jgi:hypothetical protein
MTDISSITKSSTEAEEKDKLIKVLHYLPVKQEFWKEKRFAKSKELEEVYATIAPGIPLVNVQFKVLFLKKCEEYFEELVEEKSEIMELERWDEYEIARMFGKGLNPTSLKTAQNDIKYLSVNLNLKVIP